MIFCVATKRVKFKRTRSNLDNSTSSYAVISKKILPIVVEALVTGFGGAELVPRDAAKY